MYKIKNHFVIKQRNTATQLTTVYC